MDNTSASELAATIEALRSELRGLVERVAALEQRTDGPNGANGDHGSVAAAVPAQGASASASASAPVAAVPVARQEASEEDLLVIAAAVAAFLGVRAHIRQVRLIQSAAWAQVGRATVHASHRVH